MTDDTSHKIDRTLSEVVKDAARDRAGPDWGAVKRANHEMAIIWLAFQDEDVVDDALQDSGFDSLGDLVDDVRDREFDSDFDPIAVIHGAKP